VRGEFEQVWRLWGRSRDILYERPGESIAIHEMGHSAFGLADEYGGNGTGTPGGEPPQPNVTRDTDRDTNKWGALIAASTPMPSQRDPKCAAPLLEMPPRGAVGTYEVAIFSDCNVYRPLDRCKMRTLTNDFCPVCEGVIRETLQQFLPVA
jgi:IgA Peptidase M64